MMAFNVIVGTYIEAVLAYIHWTTHVGNEVLKGIPFFLVVCKKFCVAGACEMFS
jgi:hypothetical protein